MSDAIGKIDGPDVNRLHDILVQEVSLVDRAANKQKFLMLKRGADMSDKTTGAEVVEDESGKLTTIVDTGKGASLSIQNDDKTEILSVATKALALVTKASELIKAEDDDSTAEGIPAEISKELSVARDILFTVSEKYSAVDDEAKKGIAPVDKAQTVRMATESLERLVALVGVVEGAEGVEKSDDGVPDVVTKELMAVARLVSGLIERYTVEPEPAAKSEPTADPTPAKKSWGREPAAVDKSDDTLAALAKAAQVIKPMSKAGRKMAGDRLTKLRSIATDLIDLLAEIAPEEFDSLVADAAERRAKTDKAAPAADPEKPEKPEKPETDAPAVVAKGEVMATELLTETTDALAKANVEIMRLKKTFDLPNSSTDEGSPTIAAPETQNVSWPADMNKPISKAESPEGYWFTVDE